MNRMLSFFALFLLAAAVAMAGPAESKTIYSTVRADSQSLDNIHVGGHWTPSNHGGPYAVMNGGRDFAFVAVAKSHNSRAYEFAIVADKDGARFQIIDDAGGYHSLPVTALLKLETATPPAKSSSDAPVAKADDIPAGHKLLIRFARVKAAGELAKKENISRAAARDRIDEITDADVHAVLKASPVVVKAMPVGGKLTDFLEWVAEHKDVIMAIVAIIMAFFGG